MSNRAKLVITFLKDPGEDDYLSFYRIKDSVNQAVQVKSTWKNTRVNWNETPVYPPTTPAGLSGATSYQHYFNLDHNQAGLMNLVRAGRVVTIDIDEGWSFGTFESSFSVDFEYFPATVSSFMITDVDIVPSSSPCSEVDMIVTTSQTAENYTKTSGVISGVTPVTTNPIVIPISRAFPTKISLYKTGSQPVNVEDFLGQPHIFIRKLTIDNINIQVYNTPLAGSTIQVFVSYDGQLSERPERDDNSFMYSLNGVDWQESNFFNGQIDGTYTVYVKDSFNCIRSKEVIVSGIKNQREKYIFISDINSIGFSENQKWDGNQNGIEKNNENTLSDSGTQPNLYDERIIYRQKDLLRIQIKSNYDINKAHVEGCGDGDVTNLIMDKMSNNLNIYESLDAKMFSYGDGSRTAIYYDEGSVYNRSGLVIGSHELNGNLPDSASIGNYFVIQPQGNGVGGVFQVVDRFYDSSIGKNLVIFNYDSRSDYPVDAITSVLYDLLDYEVYEFNLSFDQVITTSDSISPVGRFGIEKIFRAVITCSDEIYEDRSFYSEWIDVIRNGFEYNLNKYFSFHYFNNNNKSIFYTYGITHFIRCEVESSNTIIDDSVSIVKGDSSSYITESVVNKGISIKFADMTNKALIRAVLAISSENLFINGLGYVKKGEVEVEPVDGTNLHSLTCSFIRNAENFNTFTNGRVGGEEGVKNIYIPQLITTNLGDNLKV